MEDNGLESEESRRPKSICCRINNFPPRFMGKVNTTASAFLSLQFSLFLFTLFLENAFAMDMLSQSQGLSVRQTLISSNQLFELGFFSPGNSGKRYVGIWCKNISWHKAIWVANRENALTVADSASSLTIGSDGNLKLLDGMKNTVWSTNVSSPHPNSTISVLSDTGNLSLKDNVSGLTLWDSFNYPSDSFIAGMKIGFNKKTGENYVVTSWHAEDDPSPGNFVMGFTTDTPPQNILWNNSKTRWRSGPWDGWRFIGVPETGKGFSNGFTVTQDNQQGSVYGFLSPASMLQVMIEFVTPDGNLKVSRWEIGTQEGFVDWEAIKVFCDVYGVCGPFGFCDRSRQTCECLKGFMPKSMHEWSKGNWTSGCVRRTELACGNNKTKHDGFAKLSMMKVPDRYTYLFNMNASDCQQQCSSNCSCLAYAHVEGIGCLAWDGDLLDIQQFSSNGVDLFLRLAHSELDEEKKNIKLMVSLITTFGVIILGAFIYALLRCIKNRKAIIRHRKQEEHLFDKMAPVTASPMGEMWRHPLTPTESSDLLPMVDFDTVAAATNNFSETNKLGAGGFGPVYKGKLEDGQEIAVKRLSNLSGQGAVEFRNEILLISKLRHRNLVRLLGYCIKGDEKLLLYEYLKNKSLDTFLFDTRMGMQLDWDKRFNIIEGIARGLLYLHRDSCLRVIHRDLKPSNILLDDNMNPKISDFGLARAFQITQELENTRRVVGTFGYMSPEYAMGGLLSEKSDVFSFGVMLLEIISGKRNTSFLYEEKYLNLLGYAWHLWNEGKGLDLMNRQLSDSCSAEDFMKYMQIALLCIQDYAFDRPTMSAVVLMLTGDTIIPQPRQPTFGMGLPYSDLLSQFSRPSMNDDPITQVEGR